jgi:hypothetical protein
MIEMWLDPEIMRIESQSALTDAQVRAMLDSVVLRHVRIDTATAALLLELLPKEEKEEEKAK